MAKPKTEIIVVRRVESMDKSKKKKSKDNKPKKHKSKNTKKITTEQALESLLGRKAAKRLRRLAIEIAEADEKEKGRKKNG